MSRYATHPYFAFVNMYIGQFQVTPIPPEHLINFTQELNSSVENNGVGNASCTLFDETAINVEHALVAEANRTGGLPEVIFNYGYSETNVVSETFKQILQSYDLELKAGGAELSLTMHSGGLIAHGLPAYLAYNTNDNNQMTMNEIIADIIKNSPQWNIGEIQDIEDIIVWGDDNNGNEIEKNMEFICDGISTTKFLINKILGSCRAKDDNEVDLHLTFVDTADGLKVIVTSYGYQASRSGGPVREYTIPWDGTSDEVISFKPSFNGSNLLAAGGSSVETIAFDEDTMEPIMYDHDTLTNTAKYLIFGEETGMVPGKARLLTNSSSGNTENLRRKTNNLWKLAAQEEVTATMQILGDPFLQSYDIVVVNVLTPSGIPHHTTGAYLILNITHNIGGGTWLTTLELLRQPPDASMIARGQLVANYQGSPGSGVVPDDYEDQMLRDLRKSLPESGEEEE